MEKKLEDDELNKLLEEQFIKEADMIEEALFSDEDFEDFEETDEEVRAAYDKLVARLKADGIYREEDDSAESESCAASEIGANVVGIGDEAVNHPAGTPNQERYEKKVIPMRVEERRGEDGKGKRRYKIAKVAGFVIVATCCVFAASMTSEATRNYFIDSLQYLVGEDTRIVIDNDDRNDTVKDDEYQAISIIENDLNVELPEFMYRPRYFSFKSYKVDKFSGTARMEYLYKDKNIIAFYIDKERENSSSKIDSLHGDNMETFQIDNEDIEVKIKEIRDTLDEISSYTAQWKRKDVVYAISGKIEIDELKRMLEKLVY